MFLNLVFLLHALSSVLFAVPLLLVPAWLIGLLTGGAPVNPLAEDLARLYGVGLVLITVVTWMARSSPSSNARRIVVISMLVNEALGAVVSLTIHFPLARWVAVISYLLFAVAYAYILLFRPRDI
jgi:hypothetical protein